MKDVNVNVTVKVEDSHKQTKKRKRSYSWVRPIDVEAELAEMDRLDRAYEESLRDRYFSDEFLTDTCGCRFIKEVPLCCLAHQCGDGVILKGVCPCRLTF
jgi:hypothetical protein